MPRPHREPYVSWYVSVDAAIGGAVEAALFDRVHNRPRYGVRGALISSLLRQWVEQTADNPDAALAELLAGTGPKITVQK